MAQDTSTWSSQTLLNWLGPKVLLFFSAISLAIALALASPPLQAKAGAAAPNGLPQEISTFADMRRQRGLGVRASAVITQYLYFPIIYRDPCDAPTGNSYSASWVDSPTTYPLAENDPDRNLAVRGYVPTSASLGLVDYGGSFDPGAPQLSTVFKDNRPANFVADYRVYDWLEQCNCRGGLIAEWPVTLGGLAATPGEVVRAPVAGYDMGSMPTGYQTLVLYASTNRLTLKYTREDNVIAGYTIHIEDFCVDRNLLALYQQMNSMGRSYLPALFAGQGVGRARTNELKVAVRDWGSFMDPRSRKDWWQSQ